MFMQNGKRLVGFDGGLLGVVVPFEGDSFTFLVLGRTPGMNPLFA